MVSGLNLNLIDFFFTRVIIKLLLLPREKFLQFDWLRTVVFQFNLKYLHVKITSLLWVVAWTNNSMIWHDIWHKYRSWYFKIVSNFIRLMAHEITYNNSEISLVVFMTNIITNHAITNTNWIIVLCDTCTLRTNLWLDAFCQDVTRPPGLPPL